ncbi:MAG: cytochrome c1 [Pseudomonadales bacterium]|jgi:cytochrome c1
MKRFLTILGFCALTTPAALAADSGVHLEPMTPDHRDLPSLQQGAKLFMNYCLGCHSLEHQRHVRTAEDLGIPTDLYQASLLPAGADMGSHITNAMPAAGAKNWFGAQPPDLSMVTRVRGTDWVYSYLKGFYLDPSRPLGVNNDVLPNAGMPHALIELQGVPRKVCKQVPDGSPDGLSGQPTTSEQCGVIEVEAGTGLLSAEEYDAAIYDLVNFLDYTGEPYRLDRQRIGVYVILFLLVLYVFTWLLGREYQKEVH